MYANKSIEIEIQKSLTVLALIGFKSQKISPTHSSMSLTMSCTLCMLVRSFVRSFVRLLFEFVRCPAFGFLKVGKYVNITDMPTLPFWAGVSRFKSKF